MNLTRLSLTLLVGGTLTGYAHAGKLAIVIDDVGYRPADQAVMRLPLPVTVAILPVAPHAARMAEQAAKQQRDALIHMPMQPRGSTRVEAGALHTGMDAAAVRRTLEQALQVVPHARGLNNHMGSAATADPALMQLLMQELKARHLLFLDSRTTAATVAESTARRFGVPTLRRTVFLDDNNSLTKVQAEFQRAVSMARHKGWAVAIGHPRPNTLKVLQEGLAHLPADVQLISLRALIAELPADGKQPAAGTGKHNSAPSSGLRQPGPIIEPARTSAAAATEVNSAAEPSTAPNKPNLTPSNETGVVGLEQLDLLPAPTSVPPYRHLPLLRGQRED
ncbi:divergent polysaccharide deacetylase family protein [Plesiomonas shigelloides]|uniref:divergent polysaccharide deacetylase family protein n=1 Tax=Plesiomonas shigelloides TaxID=703 RepID=UPI001C5B6CDE|nr:divergent polysaccharide deacetylase family protein [Plesiomonas shigelloides]MBW3793841.1 divergent polysaccharide deacetylase family protein [Plesiomonas shigelloides]